MEIDYDRLRGWAYKEAKKHLSSRNSAEDVANLAIERLAVRRETIVGNPVAYFRKVLFSTLRDYVRDQRRRIPLYGDEAVVLDALERFPGDVFEDVEHALSLKPLLSEYELIYLEGTLQGYTQDQIQHQNQWSDYRIQKTIKDTRRKVREYFAELGIVIRTYKKD